MKKKLIYIGTGFLILLITSAIILFNWLFPIAQAVAYPNIDEINSFSVSYDNEQVEMSEIAFGGVLVYIKLAVPTREQAFNDNPGTSLYYKIIVDTETLEYKYYIYESNNTFYLYLPYEGIYILDDEISLLLD